MFPQVCQSYCVHACGFGIEFAYRDNVMKRYRLRVYIYTNDFGVLLNMMLDAGLFVLLNSFDGKAGLLAVYDIEVGQDVFEQLMLPLKGEFKYMPFNHYEDFTILCPNCGQVIDDRMILGTYDDTLLQGFNIRCDRRACGEQMATVRYKCRV